MEFKSRVPLLVKGFFLIFIAIVLEIVGIILILPEGTEGMIALICLTIFFNLWLVIAGIWFIREYIKSDNCLVDGLNRYGEENIIKDIETTTRIKYNCSLIGNYTYFTDRLVVHPNVAIFTYGEIAMMYKFISKSCGVRYASIAFSLIDGNTYFLCDYVNDATILNIMKHCLSHNSRILIGASKENKIRYKEYVRMYKNGHK